jgi:hypothetical protein
MRDGCVGITKPDDRRRWGSLDNDPEGSPDNGDSIADADAAPTTRGAAPEVWGQTMEGGIRQMELRRA